MKYRLTQELLTYLKAKGYTMLVGLGQAGLKDFIFTPVEWDVEEYVKNSHTFNYENHAIHFIDDLLKVDLKSIYMHRVVLPVEPDIQQ